MTYPKEAVEAVARVIAGMKQTTWDAFVYEEMPSVPIWRKKAEALLDQIAPMLTARAEADKQRAVEAERERCAVIADGVDAKAFRARYEVFYTKKRFDQYSYENGVNNALNIQSEDAAAAIRAQGVKP